MSRTHVVAVLMLAALTALPSPAGAWTRRQARTFATLPEGATAPEGLEVDAAGNVYATEFGFTNGGPVEGPGQLDVFTSSGKLMRRVPVAGSSAHLLALAFHPATRALLVVDFGGARVLAVDPETGASTPFLTLPQTLPHPELGGAGLNDVTFDRAGNVYVSDSFQGVVWRTGPDGGVASVWVDDPLLRTTGVPPFGANGLRFDRDEAALYVANTGGDMVVKVPVTGGAAGTPEVFVTGINGADGLLVDRDGNLWVVANQADEIVVVDPGGRAIAKLGDFDGIGEKGAPVGLLFPASLRFSGDSLLVTNLALDLRLFNPAFASVDSPWTAEVTRSTIARLPARIPPIRSRE
ncbi:SMP-30/gluconolactonase/LRE family protein [Anaeromyxobacter terrae]|uniref:SMP-30/gluconolactonase/LRE family protein n=1 Tax=Anaeromyxobacter terrae TaxID=2925406 RepID=UPI001F56FAFB|nr:SMP-30/gluconolactonase/LRE family protein [Anaeromyxobacter sp. SG22]